MSEHQYTHVNGNITGVSAADNSIYFEFATGYNGRGDVVEVRIGDKECSFEAFKRGKIPKKFEHVPFNELIDTLRPAIR
jgi:hypothetical protein